jgi:hypothetical protein
MRIRFKNAELYEISVLFGRKQAGKFCNFSAKSARLDDRRLNI